MKKSLLQGLLGVLVLLVSVFFFKPFLWLLISAGVILLSFILAQGGRGREQWVLLPLMILSLGLAPRLWGELLATFLIPWVGGIVGMAILAASIKGAPLLSLPRILIWSIGLCVLLIWADFPELWSAYFWLAAFMMIGCFCFLSFVLGTEMVFNSKNKVSIMGAICYAVVLFFVQTVLIWTVGTISWVLSSGGIALLGFVSGLLWESRAEIRKKIQALNEEVIEGWKIFFSASRDEE